MYLIIKRTLVVAILYFSAMSPAYAYIDPGSGSMIMTTVLGVIAAIGYTMRKYFYRIRNMFRPKSDDNADKSSTED